MKKSAAFALSVLLVMIFALASASGTTWKCPYCGYYMSENFCSYCGTKRPSATPTPKVTPVPTQAILKLSLPEELSNIEDYAFAGTAANVLVIPKTSSGVTFSSDSLTDSNIQFIVNLSNEEIDAPAGVEVVNNLNMIKFASTPTPVPTSKIITHKKFGFSCPDGSDPFFIAIESAIREVLEENDCQLISFDSDNNNEKQISQIEDLISQGIDGLFVCPVDKDGIVPALDELKQSGIPIFGFHTEVADMSYEVTYVESDNYNAGYECGFDLAKKCPQGGNIIVLDAPTVPNIVYRTNGFLKAIKDSGVKFNIVAQIDSQGSLETGNKNAAAALAAHPEAVCIFGGNDSTAIGAYNAAKSIGSTVLIYGVGGSPEIKSLIAEGKITGTGAQSPISIGKTIAKLAYYHYFAGKTIDQVYPIATFIINSDNIADYNNGGWQ